MSDKNSDYSELNKKIQEKFTEMKKEWRSKVIKIIRNLSEIDLDASKHTQLHMDMLILREDLVFEIASYKDKLAQLKSMLRKQKKTKYHNYSVNFDLKLTSFYDKDVYISGDLTEQIRQIDIFENFIYFLKEQILTCDKMGFSIKHLVDANRM